MNILGFWAPGPLELIIIIVIGVIPILAIFFVIRYFTRIRSGQEQIQKDLREIKEQTKNSG